MTQRAKTALCLLCSAGALLLGAAVYIFCRQGTYIHTCLQTLFGVSLPRFCPDGRTGAVVRNWLGDFIWSFALCFALAVVCRPLRHRFILATAVPVLLGAFLEILQFAGVISGTADILDVLAEAAAVLCAGIILKRGNLL